MCKEVRSKNLPPKMVVNMGVSENELYPKMTILIEKHYGYPVLRKKNTRMVQTILLTTSEFQHLSVQDLEPSWIVSISIELYLVAHPT